MLGDVAKRFQYSNIRVDVLSVYEDRATKIEKTKFFSKSSKQIVSIQLFRRCTELILGH